MVESGLRALVGGGGGREGGGLSAKQKPGQEPAWRTGKGRGDAVLKLPKNSLERELSRGPALLICS